MATERRGNGREFNEELEATRDALFEGRVVLLQPRRGAGYRTNVDALLLAAFAARSGAAMAAGVAAPARPARVAYDLGAGVGAVGLTLLQLQAAHRVVFVEVNGRAARLAQANLDANGWGGRGEVLLGEVQEVAARRRGEAALVVCNPPYFAPGRGRAAPEEELARIGHVAPFVHAARQLAGRRARVCFSYPAYELFALLVHFANHGMHAKRLRFVHGTPGVPARIALVEAQPARSGGLVVLPPLVEREDGRHSAEMRRLLGPGGPTQGP